MLCPSIATFGRCGSLSGKSIICKSEMILLAQAEGKEEGKGDGLKDGEVDGFILPDGVLVGLVEGKLVADGTWLEVRVGRDVGEELNEGAFDPTTPTTTVTAAGAFDERGTPRLTANPAKRIITTPRKHLARRCLYHRSAGLKGLATMTSPSSCSSTK